MVSAACRFANGAFGTIEATTAAFPGFPEEIVLTGTAGTLVLRGSELQARFHDGRAETVEPDHSSGGTGADPMAFPHHYHRALWADFLEAVATGRDPRVTGEQALKVHHLIDALVETGRQGGAPVRVAA